MAPSKKQNKGKKSRSKKKQYKKKYEKKRKEHTLIGKLKRKFRTWKKRRQRKRKKYAVEDEMDEEVTSEESEIEGYEKKLYWGRAITGVVTSILGVLVFNLVGWDMFIYFILFLLVFPFIISFAILRIPYEKDKWDWKNIMKKGVAPQFFLFMLISTICHTYVVVDNYDTQFNNPADTQAIYIQDEEYMFVADGTNGILSLNHTLPGGHRWLQDSEKPNGSTIAIEMHNGYGYFINTEQGLMIYNMSEPDNLKLVSKNASFTKAADLYIL